MWGFGLTAQNNVSPARLVSITSAPRLGVIATMNNKLATSNGGVVSVGDSLDMTAFNSLRDHAEKGFAETVLVAPNVQIQKLWRKQYPGIKVLLSERLPINLPTNSTKEGGAE
jgi:predicted component of type VI protein secretion system